MAEHQVLHLCCCLFGANISAFPQLLSHAISVPWPCSLQYWYCTTDRVDESESDMVTLDYQSPGHKIILCLQEWLGMGVSSVFSFCEERSFCLSTKIIKWRSCTQNRKRFRFWMANSNVTSTYMYLVCLCILSTSCSTSSYVIIDHWFWIEIVLTMNWSNLDENFPLYFH